MIIQVPRGSAVHRQLSELDLPAEEVVVEAGETDAAGNLEAIIGGKVVLSVAAPEALSRDAAELRRVIDQAGTGTAPLVVEIEAAEELPAEDLNVILKATEQAPRPVILRVMRQ